MASNTIRRLTGPLFLTTAVIDVYKLATYTITTGASLTPYAIIRHIHIANETAGAVTFSLYQSAVSVTETAGKSLFTLKSVAANDVYDWYGALRVEVADYIVGHCGTGGNTAVVVELEGEVGLF